MKTLVVIFCVLAWFVIGYFITLLKKKIWRNFVIKYAKEYSKFDNAPLSFIVPVSIIWPVQVVHWVCYEGNENDISAVPIIPKSIFLGEGDKLVLSKSNLNLAVINNDDEFLDHEEREKKNLKDYMSLSLGISFLFGPLNIVFWLIEMAAAILFILIAHLIYTVPKHVGKIFQG